MLWADSQSQLAFYLIDVKDRYRPDRNYIGSITAQWKFKKIASWDAYSTKAAFRSAKWQRMYEGESIKNQPNLFLDEIDRFFFDVIAL